MIDNRPTGLDSDEIEPSFLLKRSLWIGIVVVAVLFAISYVPLPDTKTLLRGIVLIALVGGMFIAYCRDTR